MQLVEIEIVEEQVHLAGLDLGDVEDVVDHRQQVLAGGADLLQVGDLLAAPVELRVLEQHLAVADDGVERRAQLVAHLGQELGLGAVGALGFLLGMRELASAVASVALDLAQQLGLRVDDLGVVAGHHQHVHRRRERRDDADADHVLDRNVDGERLVPQVGQIECTRGRRRSARTRQGGWLCSTP